MDKVTCINGIEVVLKESLFGVSYWAEYYLDRIPKYNVFRYVGCSRDGDLHVFFCKKTKGFYAKAARDLYKFDFYPFLLNNARIEAYCKSVETKA